MSAAIAAAVGFAVLTAVGMIAFTQQPNHRSTSPAIPLLIGLFGLVSCLGVALGEWSASDVRTYYGRP